jgi:methyl-accepting chemotaxis protein
MTPTMVLLRNFSIRLRMLGAIGLIGGVRIQALTRKFMAHSIAENMTQRNAALVEHSAAAADALQSQALRLAELVEHFRIDPQAKTLTA